MLLCREDIIQTPNLGEPNWTEYQNDFVAVVNRVMIATAAEAAQITKNVDHHHIILCVSSRWWCGIHGGDGGDSKECWVFFFACILLYVSPLLHHPNTSSITYPTANAVPLLGNNNMENLHRFAESFFFAAFVVCVSFSCINVRYYTKIRRLKAKRRKKKKLENMWRMWGGSSITSLYTHKEQRGIDFPYLRCPLPISLSFKLTSVVTFSMPDVNMFIGGISGCWRSAHCRRL